jgi:hypothetical protein
MSDLSFDNHQFAGRKNYPVNATNGISFDDYGKMHSETHGAKPTAFVPPFALNDKQLQKVLLFRAWRYAHGGAAFPEQVDRDSLNRRATRKALEGYAISNDAPPIHHRSAAMFRATVKKAGGYLELHAAIAFRSWRLGMDSVAVAKSLGTTPQAVRQTLWRLRDLAGYFGFDVGRAGHTAGKHRNRPENRMSVATPKLIELCERGMSIWAIVAEVGLTNDRIDYNYVRTRLLAAGMHPHKNKPGQGGPAVDCA